RLSADDVAAGVDGGTAPVATTADAGALSEGDGGVAVTAAGADGGVDKPDNDTRDPAFKATLARADDDVLDALKRPGLVRSEAEAIASLKQPFNKYDVARVGNDQAKLAAASSSLAAEIGRANIPRFLVEQRIERVTNKLKRKMSKFTKKQLILTDKQVSDFRA